MYHLLLGSSTSGLCYWPHCRSLLYFVLTSWSVTNHINSNANQPQEPNKRPTAGFLFFFPGRRSLLYIIERRLLYTIAYRVMVKEVLKRLDEDFAPKNAALGAMALGAIAVMKVKSAYSQNRGRGTKHLL